MQGDVAVTHVPYFDLRAAMAEDAPLLQQIFVESRVDEFAALGLPADQLQPLLEMQFRAQRMDYARTCPDAMECVLLRRDDGAVGSLRFARTDGGIRIMDIAVLKRYRGQRLGAMALQHVQRIAAQAGLPVVLRVRKTNPARRLYMRQGFRVVAEDAQDVEMEWRLSHDEGDLPGREVTRRCLEFLQQIGFCVELAPCTEATFLPGIQMIRNGLRIDMDRLLYPGDLLHEAGHLAVMEPAQRVMDPPEPVEMGEEIAATAWSYAAARHLGIPVTQVIHDSGFRGAASTLREILASDSGPGVPLLQWMGLTTCGGDGRPGLYPRMLAWVRA